MLRTALIIAVVACLPKTSSAVVESVDLQTTLTTEKTATAVTSCSETYVTRRFNFKSGTQVDDLEDCGVSLTSQFSGQDRPSFRFYNRAHSPYGFASLLFTRRFPLPLSGGRRHRPGVGILSSLDLRPGLGATEASASLSLVERLPPPGGSSEGAILSLDLLGEGLHNFSTADVRVFDHDTDELLLSWSYGGEPLEPNNGKWFSQELGFEDRIGHAIRIEYEAAARILGRSSELTAAVFLNVPEPNARLLAVPCTLAFGFMRNKRHPPVRSP